MAWKWSTLPGQTQTLILAQHMHTCPVHGTQPGSERAAARQQWELGSDSRNLIGQEQRDRKGLLTRITEIQETHRSSTEPHKHKEKKIPSHYKETLLKAVHYYTCIIAQSHLRDGLTRIKGGCVRITTRACRRASCFATAHAQTWATFSAQNCPLQTVTSVIYHSESQQNNPAHCCRSAAGHLIPFSSSLKNHQSSCSFCVFHLLLLSPPLPPLLESGYIWFLQAAWNTPWQSDLQNSVWSCNPSSHMLFLCGCISDTWSANNHLITGHLKRNPHRTAFVQAFLLL